MTAGETAMARCIRERAIERAFPDAGELREHLDGCPRCTGLWAELEELRRLGDQLPEARPQTEQVEAIRTALLAGIAAPAPAAPATAAGTRRWALPAAAALLAAAAAIAFWMTRAGSTSPREDATHDAVPSLAGGEPAWGAAQAQTPRVATIQAPQGAKFVHTAQTEGAGTDEVVRLSTGRLTVAVPSLAPDHRVRVVSGDAEVEGQGARVDVEVVNDELREVVVHTGSVVVRVRGREPMLMAAGSRWTPASAEPIELSLLDQPTDIAAQPADEPALAPLPAHPDSLSAHPERSRPEAGGAKGQRGTMDGNGTVTWRVPETETEPETEPEPEAEPEAEPEPAPSREPVAIEKAFAQAWTAFRARDFAAAAVGFAQAAALDSSHALAEDARYWRAIALARGGRRSASRTAMTEFLARHPGSARAREVSVMLGWILLEDGDRDGAALRFRAGLHDASPDVRASARKGLETLR